MAEERIRIGDQYYLLASAVAPHRPRLLLNDANSFGVFDGAGDLPVAALEPYGLFHRGTRFLDRFELRLDGEFPIVLSSAESEDGTEIVTHLTNGDERRNQEITLVRDTVEIRRRKTLHDRSLFEELRLHNYGCDPLRLSVSLLFGADFVDVFELRGLRRKARGVLRDPVVEERSVRLGYVGLDGVRRDTVIGFSERPAKLSPETAEMDLTLAPGEEKTVEIRVDCEVAEAPAVARSFATALAATRTERERFAAGSAWISSSEEGFDRWLGRSRCDLAMLRASDVWGSYVYAGIPWYATVFGRDGLVTGLETLAFAPALSAGVLRTLATLQGTRVDAERDEEPGKIVHEMRHGEMAALGEVPFGRYYGSIDSTPLFLVLFTEYADRTADRALVDELWPAALAAMRWIDEYGDRDGDGYVEYERRGPRGLVNQGWKDSHDAISHADGSLADPPIALVEVQAYVYAARLGMARLARRIGRAEQAGDWERKAAELRRRFNRDFWLEERETFALALDGRKRPCAVASSNAGHALLAGIVDADKAGRLAESMMRGDMFCGWGLRTLSARERRYNPMSYHNGSVWPHDNAIIAAGFARGGASAKAATLLTSFFDASGEVGDERLPELFCGFPRDRLHGPVPYPVACKPQAWAAGSVFLLLQACLGLRIDAWERRITFEHAARPAWLDELEIRGLDVCGARVDVNLSKGREGFAVEVIEKRGDVEVIVRS